MAASITQVCEAVVQAVREFWGPSSPDAVTRDYLPDLNPGADWPSGRRVYVFPVASAQTEVTTRGEDTWEHGVMVIVAEQCSETGADPSKEWVDVRVDFVDGLLRILGDVRRDRRTGGLLKGLVCQAADVPVWYDPEELKQKKRFFAQLVFAYRRLETG
jgi:hypothetical protein